MDVDRRWKLYILFAKGVDEVPMDSNYIDERLVFRAQNIMIGLNLLGQECKKETTCSVR